MTDINPMFQNLLVTTVYVLWTIPTCILTGNASRNLQRGHKCTTKTPDGQYVPLTTIVTPNHLQNDREELNAAIERQV